MYHHPEKQKAPRIFLFRKITQLFQKERSFSTQTFHHFFWRRGSSSSFSGGGVATKTLHVPCWVVVSNILYVHPYLGKISILTSIFFKWGWFNHQPASKCSLGFFLRRDFSASELVSGLTSQSGAGHQMCFGFCFLHDGFPWDERYFLPTWTGWFFMVNVGKYTLHGCYVSKRIHIFSSQ